jgi:hypothetical protein
VMPRFASAELALDDVERNVFAGHLDGVCVTQLVRAMRCRTPAATARRFSVVRTAEGDHGRPAVAPSMTHSRAPTGRVTR